jgi:hypothetical protein
MKQDDESKQDLVTFKLSKDFVVMIDEIKNNSLLHFESRAEILRTAVRFYYENLKKEKMMKES